MKKDKYWVEFHYCVEVKACSSKEAYELGVKKYKEDNPTMQDHAIEVTNSGESVEEVDVPWQATI